jgi:hypothetical protein
LKTEGFKIGAWRQTVVDLNQRKQDPSVIDPARMGRRANLSLTNFAYDARILHVINHSADP